MLAKNATFKAKMLNSLKASLERERPIVEVEGSSSSSSDEEAPEEMKSQIPESPAHEISGMTESYEGITLDEAIEKFDN